MEIRQLTDADALTYHELRLRGLREHPEAFTSSFEEESIKPLGWAQARLAHSAEASYNFVLGAFSDARLIGIVGVSVEPRAKIQHKGNVFGMYVAPEYAGRGVGQRLLTACIERAREIPGLEQLQLTVTDSNARARSLYEKAGFRAFGLEENALKIGAQYFHKCHMTLDLTSRALPHFQEAGVRPC
jgi:RimJ/RimL family protein N-acetyltransferase